MAQRLNDADFHARLAGFLAAAQLKVDAYNAQFSHLANATPLRVDGNGVKYIRIVSPGSGVYVFVSRETGDILKAATFTKPVTTTRAATSAMRTTARVASTGTARCTCDERRAESQLGMEATDRRAQGARQR